jgi:hypothetical protein
MAKSSSDADKLECAQLKSLLVQALEEEARLEAERKALRKENARLRARKGQSNRSPSGAS